MAHVTRSSLDGGLSDIFNHLKINKESVPGTGQNSARGSSCWRVRTRTEMELEKNSANNFPVTLKMYGGAGSKALRFLKCFKEGKKQRCDHVTYCISHLFLLRQFSCSVRETSFIV